MRPNKIAFGVLFFIVILFAVAEIQKPGTIESTITELKEAGAEECSRCHEVALLHDLDGRKVCGDCVLQIGSKAEKDAYIYSKAAFAVIVGIALVMIFFDRVRE